MEFGLQKIILKIDHVYKITALLITYISLQELAVLQYKTSRCGVKIQPGSNYCSALLQTIFFFNRFKKRESREKEKTGTLIEYDNTHQYREKQMHPGTNGIG